MNALAGPASSTPEDHATQRGGPAPRKTKTRRRRRQDRKQTRTPFINSSMSPMHELDVSGVVSDLECLSPSASNLSLFPHA